MLAPATQWGMHNVVDAFTNAAWSQNATPRVAKGISHPTSDHVSTADRLMKEPCPYKSGAGAPGDVQQSMAARSRRAVEVPAPWSVPRVAAAHGRHHPTRPRQRGR